MKSNLNRLITRVQKKVALLGIAKLKRGRCTTNCKEDIIVHMSFKELPRSILINMLRVAVTPKVTAATFSIASAFVAKVLSG